MPLEASQAVGPEQVPLQAWLRRDPHGSAHPGWAWQGLTVASLAPVASRKSLTYFSHDPRAALQEVTFDLPEVRKIFFGSFHKVLEGSGRTDTHVSPCPRSCPALRSAYVPLPKICSNFWNRPPWALQDLRTCLPTAGCSTPGLPPERQNFPDSYLCPCGPLCLRCPIFISVESISALLSGLANPGTGPHRCHVADVQRETEARGRAPTGLRGGIRQQVMGTSPPPGRSCGGTSMVSRRCTWPWAAPRSSSMWTAGRWLRGPSGRPAAHPPLASSRWGGWPRPGGPGAAQPQ